MSEGGEHRQELSGPPERGPRRFRRGLLLLLLLSPIAYMAGREWPSTPMDVVRAAVRWISDPIVLERVERFAEPIRFAAAESGLDPNLIAGVVYAESSGRPSAVSRVGAKGLMQLMPAAAADASKALGLERPSGEALLTDAQLNLRLGAQHLAWTLRAEGGELERGLVAYNAGRTKLARWIEAAGSYNAWVARCEERDACAALVYARHVLHYAEVFKDRGHITTAPSAPLVETSPTD